MFYTGFVTYSYQIFSTMKKLVILVVAVLSINLAFGQENKVDKDPVFVGCEDLSTKRKDGIVYQKKLMRILLRILNIQN